MASSENTSQLDLSPIWEPLKDTVNIVLSCLSNQTFTPFLQSGITEIFTFSIGFLFFLALSIYTFVLLRYLVKYIALGRKLKRITKLNNVTETEEKISQQRSILKSINTYFLDSLTEYNGKLYSNQDIETFFSTQNLAPCILHSKFLPLTPILLTGLGVLGTFLGLQLGLSGLELDGDTDKLQHGIRAVAEGAAVAFATSVYGVSSSLAFNLIEKIYFALCSRKIHSLQVQIEQLYPPFPVMNVFTAIEQYNKTSDEYLGGLAEQIGITMQQSFQKASDNLGAQFASNIASASKDISSSLVESINNSLVPAVESISSAAQDLSSRQAKSAESTLNALIEKFSAGMGEEGRHQREAMTNASDKMEATLVEFNTAMQNAIKGLYDKQNSLAETQEKHMQQLHENMQETLQLQKNMMSELQSTVTQHIGASESVIAQGQTLHNDTKQTHSNLANLAESLEKTSVKFSDASIKLHSFSSEIQNTMERTANSVDGAMSVVQSVSASYEKTVESLTSTIRAFDKLQDVLTTTSTHLGNSVDSAQKGMSTIIETFVNTAGAEGDNQREAMTTASTNLETSLNTFSAAMRDMIVNLHDKQSIMGEAQDNHMQKLHENMQTTLRQQENMMTVLRELIEKHVGATESVVQQGRALQSDTNQTYETLSALATAMQGTSESLTDASIKLHSFSDNIRSSMDQTTTTVNNAMSIVQKTSSDYQIVSSQFKETKKSFEDLQGTFATASTEIKDSIQKAYDGFQTVLIQYNDLQNNLRTYTKEMGEITQEQVTALDEHMAKLLEAYSVSVNRQVKERMNDWNEQTKQFSENMIAVVQTMGELVENLDQRPGQSR